MSPKFLSAKVSIDSLPKVQNIQKINDTFISKSDKYTVSVPLDSAGSIMLKEKISKAFKKAKSKKGTYNFMLSLPNKDTATFSGQAKVSKDNSIVYKDYQENTDVVVQALEEGSLRILTILNDADAPREYIYNVNLPIGGHMKKKDDGSISILDANKKFIGAFTPAWAIDKSGKHVPTHYEIKGNKLVQVVDHLSGNYTYPIVADPYYGTKMVKNAYWRKWPRAGNGWYDYRLYVIPTKFGRSLKGKFYGAQGWRELQGMVWYLNYNRESLIKQYVCHVHFGWIRAKTEYHLEQWSPNKPYATVLAWGCNVPGHI